MVIDVKKFTLRLGILLFAFAFLFSGTSFAQVNGLTPKEQLN